MLLPVGQSRGCSCLKPCPGGHEGAAGVWAGSRRRGSVALLRSRLSAGYGLFSFSPSFLRHLLVLILHASPWVGGYWICTAVAWSAASLLL